LSLGGGFDRDWLEELKSDGSLDMSADGIYEETIGCHQGKWKGYNVGNPQAGFEYIWMLDPSAGGRGENVSRGLEIQTCGGQIVQTTDPEMAMFEKLAGDQGISTVNGYVTNGEVCLVRIPSEKIREKREEELAQSQAQLRGATEASFIAGASAAETLAGNGRPTRFAGIRHATEFQDGGATRELHTPDSGIAREDPSQ